MRKMGCSWDIDKAFTALDDGRALLGICVNALLRSWNNVLGKRKNKRSNQRRAVKSTPLCGSCCILGA